MCFIVWSGSIGIIFFMCDKLVVFFVGFIVYFLSFFCLIFLGVEICDLEICFLDLFVVIILLV